MSYPEFREDFFETSLPTFGPVDSALKIKMLCPSEEGRIANTNTNTPIPPIQWVNNLQNNIDWLNASTLLNIEAPVVVKPDTVSKKASKKLLKFADFLQGKWNRDWFCFGAMLKESLTTERKSGFLNASFFSLKAQENLIKRNEYQNRRH